MGLMTARSSSAKFIVEDPRLLDADERPQWQSQFGNCQPIKLEIGFGVGDFLIAMATREPRRNFVGIDFSQNGIRKLLARSKSLRLNNIRVVYGDAREKIPLLFRDGELAAVYVNFPDPWPKKRHFKRRLMKPALARLLAVKLTATGRVYLATDSEPYALEMREYFDAEPLLQNVNPAAGFFADRDHLPKTKYEKSFIYAGDKIHYLEYSRSPDDGKAEKPRGDAVATVSAPAIKNDVARRTKNFRDAEAKAKDACDLKRVGDDLVDAGEKQWAKKVYRKAADAAEDSLDLNWLAYSVAAAFGDKEWAARLYRQAEGRADDGLDFNWLAFGIAETLGDKDWAARLFRQAESENVRELCDLADSIFAVLGDRRWGIKIFRKAEEMAAEFSDFYELADCVYLKLGDKDWAARLYRQAEDKAEDSSDLHSLVECIYGNLGDAEWAKNVYRNAESLARDSGDFRGLADSLYENFGDAEWATRLYKVAEGKAAEGYELRWLAESLRKNFGNAEWARRVDGRAKSKA